MTKQLNKKGTSLVELIAVIVIMGIIAGIAIPTTIAVINRQKKNAAVKSAENAFAAAKNVLLEASTGTLAPAADASHGVAKTDDTYSINTAGLVALEELEKEIVTAGTITFSLTGTNTFSVTCSGAKVNGVDVYYSNGAFTTTAPANNG